MHRPRDPWKVPFTACSINFIPVRIYRSTVTQASHLGLAAMRRATRHLMTRSFSWFKNAFSFSEKRSICLANNRYTVTDINQIRAATFKIFIDLYSKRQTCYQSDKHCLRASAMEKQDIALLDLRFVQQRSALAQSRGKRMDGISFLI